MPTLRSLPPSLLLCVCLALTVKSLQGCSPSSKIEPEPTTLLPGAGLAGAGGAGGMGETAGQGGFSGVDGTSGMGGSSSSKPVHCPSGRGPNMVLLEGPTGSYCMDRTEVTKGHYKSFMAEVGTSPDKLAPQYADLKNFAQCAKANFEFGPSGYDEPGPVFEWNEKDPMRDVDVCDAYAYCRWAGKRLCGKMGGGVATEESGSSPETSEWMWACTNGGTSKFPTGSSYEPGVCEYKYKYEEGKESQCRGNTSPYDQIEDLLGGVTEFTSECIWKDGTFSKGCGVRGGSPNGMSDQLNCGFRFTSINSPGGGIRCCADPEP